MYEKLKQDLYSAQKNKDSLKVSVLRFLISAIKNKEIELRSTGAEINDEMIVKLIKKQIKQRIEASEGYTKVGRPEDSERELNEKAILETYLPEEISHA